MLVRIPAVLSKAEVAHCRRVLEAAEWVDGKVTAGYQSAKSKNNIQLLENSDAANQLGDIILAALANNNLFMSAALPLKIFPPLFNCYQGGHSFGVHVDNAIRQVKGTAVKVRTDLSMTLFFSEPEEYDGGEYNTANYSTHGSTSCLFPSSSGHHHTPSRFGQLRFHGRIPQGTGRVSFQQSRERPVKSRSISQQWVCRLIFLPRRECQR